MLLLCICTFWISMADKYTWGLLVFSNGLPTPEHQPLGWRDIPSRLGVARSNRDAYPYSPKGTPPPCHGAIPPPLTARYCYEGLTVTCPLLLFMRRGNQEIAFIANRRRWSAAVGHAWQKCPTGLSNTCHAGAPTNPSSARGNTGWPDG